MDKIREELLQKLTGQVFSVMKQVHHNISAHDTSLSPPQAQLLITIARSSNNGLSVKELAESINVTPGAITQFADALIKKGLVERESDINDRRIVRMKLTTSGRSQFETLTKEFLAAATQAFDILSNDEVTLLITMLNKVNSRSETKEKEL